MRRHRQQAVALRGLLALGRARGERVVEPPRRQPALTREGGGGELTRLEFGEELVGGGGREELRGASVAEVLMVMPGSMAGEGHLDQMGSPDAYIPTAA